MQILIIPNQCHKHTNFKHCSTMILIGYDLCTHTKKRINSFSFKTNSLELYKTKKFVKIAELSHNFALKNRLYFSHLM